MSSEQWAAIMRGDESYAGSPSYFRFEKAIQDVTGMPEVIPTHQGRAAERILFQTLCKPGNWVFVEHALRHNPRQRRSGRLPNYEPSLQGTCEHPLFPPTSRETSTSNALTELKITSRKVALVVMTITNNSGGGQPASLANLRGCAELCRKHKVPLVVDGCRFAENAWFIKLREKGYADKTPRQIAREIFDCADLTSVSAKKDGMANIGGFLDLAQSRLGACMSEQPDLDRGLPDLRRPRGPRPGCHRRRHRRGPR